MNTADRIRANNAAVREATADLDTSRTETVAVGDVRVGDVLLRVGPADGASHTFPFPFTVTRVRTARGGCWFTYAHGGFNAAPYPSSDPVVRVAR